MHRYFCCFADSYVTCAITLCPCTYVLYIIVGFGPIRAVYPCTGCALSCTLYPSLNYNKSEKKTIYSVLGTVKDSHILWLIVRSVVI